MRQAARHVSQIYDTHLASTGIKGTQYSILAKLGRLGPLTINELAKLMVMDRTTLGRAVRPLQRDRLLSIGGGDDGRTRVLRLTATGEARLKVAAAKWREAQKEFEVRVRRARGRRFARRATPRRGGGVTVWGAQRALYAFPACFSICFLSRG